MTKKYEFDWKVPVPQPLLDGCLCDRWIESKSDTAFETDCMYKVDDNGFFLYWKSEGHEGDVIDLCQVSDIRTGGVPTDSRLMSKLTSKHDAAGLDCKSLTICTNENYIDIEYTHVVFPDAATAKVWQDALRNITHNNKASNVSPRMSLMKHWIGLGFCVDVNGKVPVKVILKTFASGKTEKLVFQALKDLELPDGKNDSIDKELFTFEKFWELYKKICPRNDIEELFRTITKGQGDGIKMTAFINFMNDFQRDPNMNEILYPKYDIKRCTEIINDYEMDEKKKSLKQLSIEGFTRYLMSDENAPIFLDTLSIHQDMDQPLAHYYINSSHNTYLSGRQFGGKSTVEMYRQTLLAGCRCVELDCWDGADDEPMITHGHAMCTEISYKDVIYAIRDCAFVSSEYPVILSFENHCCRAQQYKMAKYCDEIFGDLLCKEPLPDFPLEPGRALPSPALLKNKILIKNKRMKPEVEKAEMELFLKGELKTDDDAKEDATVTPGAPAELTPGAAEDTPVQSAEAVAIAAHTGSTTNVHPWLSSLVNYAEPIHFNGFENADKKNISHNMSSFAESKGLDYLKTNAIDFVNYNKRQMSRIYPKGTRADSSNYMPQLFWNAGCQMVSLNFQTSDLPMQLNQGKFEYNGACGYLLKPDFMRRADVEFDPFSDTPIDGVIAQCVKVSVIAGSFLSDKKVGTYVEVDMFGLPSDTIKKEFRTRIVPANGLNPQYNEDPFVFRKVVLPNLAVLRFGVYDENDKCLGQRILPMDSIQVGYRHISLRTEANFPMSLPCLFVHIDVSIYIPDGFGDFMTALSDPGAFAKAANSTKVKMAALGIEATDAGAAANALKGPKPGEQPMVFEVITVDLLKDEKGFQKLEKKNKKELDGARKKAHKERTAMQKKDNANIERALATNQDVKSNTELKKLIKEQNIVWAEMIGRHRKVEFAILKKHLAEQEDQLRAQMVITQAAQMKQLKDKYIREVKEKEQANVKANVEMSKEVNFDASVKTKGDKERRLRELKANALKRFLEEKKTMGLKHERAQDKLTKAHTQQLADFPKELKQIIDAYTVEEEEMKACAKNEFFV